jgi:hypothetical protein
MSFDQAKCSQSTKLDSKPIAGGNPTITGENPFRHICHGVDKDCSHLLRGEPKSGTGVDALNERFS